MNAIAGLLSVLPEQMRDPVLFAIPFFLLLLILEWTAARKLERIERQTSQSVEETPRGRKRSKKCYVGATVGALMLGKFLINWCARRDSNSRPPGS